VISVTQKIENYIYSEVEKIENMNINRKIKSYANGIQEGRAEAFTEILFLIEEANYVDNSCGSLQKV
jgi:hypothetical protein